MLAYERYGKRSSRCSLIFLHGSTMTKEGMLPIVRQFKEYNCFVLDLAGHGESFGDMPDSVATIAKDVEDTILAMEKKRVFRGKVVLLGYSMGGAITYEVALRKRIKLDGIVFLSSGADLQHYTPMVEQLKTMPVEQFKTRDIVDFLFGSMVKGEKKAKMKQTFLSTSVADNIGYNDLMISNAYNRIEQAKEVDIPTLLVHGCEDKIVLPSAAIETWKQISDSQLLMVPYGGHALIFEDGKLVSQRIKGFLERL